MYKKIMMPAAFFICLFVLQAWGSNFDGTQTMICALIDLTQCTTGDACTQVTAESVALPRFIKIETKDKLISGNLADGAVKSVPIERMEQQEGNLILQGMQNGRGWSMTVMEDTGELSLAVSGSKLGFFVSGACMIP